MSLKCKLGFHKWNGCKCSECGKNRDEHHDWSNDCEKCSVCGEVKNNSHNWNGCICLKCKITRDEGHDWSKDCEKCSKCSKIREEQHDNSKDCWVCSICGKEGISGHDCDKDCEKCSICGKIIENNHDWVGCECHSCWKIRDEQHNWKENCEKCSVCKKKREIQHDWDGCKCKNCNLENHNWVNFKCSICGKSHSHEFDSEFKYCLVCNEKSGFSKAIIQSICLEQFSDLIKYDNFSNLSRSDFEFVLHKKLKDSEFLAIQDCNRLFSQYSYECSFIIKEFSKYLKNNIHEIDKIRNVTVENATKDLMQIKF